MEQEHAGCRAFAYPTKVRPPASLSTAARNISSETASTRKSKSESKPTSEQRAEGSAIQKRVGSTPSRSMASLVWRRLVSLRRKLAGGVGSDEAILIVCHASFLGLTGRVSRRQT